jgi:hypothetical protein
MLCRSRFIVNTNIDLLTNSVAIFFLQTSVSYEMSAVKTKSIERKHFHELFFRDKFLINFIRTGEILTNKICSPFIKWHYRLNSDCEYCDWSLLKIFYRTAVTFFLKKKKLGNSPQDFCFFLSLVLEEMFI